MFIASAGRESDMNRDSTSCEVFGPERDELERVVKHADSSAALKLCRKLHESLESSDIEISVVAPVFNEARAIQQFYERVSAVMEELEVDYELVLVNDGSSDATPSLLDQLVEADPRVVVVELTRNFGHQRAISAGIDWARGNAIVVIDADLQDPP